MGKKKQRSSEVREVKPPLQGCGLIGASSGRHCQDGINVSPFLLQHQVFPTCSVPQLGICVSARAWGMVKSRGGQSSVPVLLLVSQGKKNR